MAATGNEIVKLSQLKLLKDAAWSQIDTKMSKPAADGTNGQMLVANGDQTYRFVDVPEGTTYTADEVTLHLDGTQFSIKDGVIKTKASERLQVPDRHSGDRGNLLSRVLSCHRRLHRQGLCRQRGCPAEGQQQDR